MSRKELYNKIKELGIAKEIEKKFHQNYTRVSNSSLESFINGFAKPAATSKSKKTGNYDKVIIRLVSTLQAKRYLNATEAEDVLNMLPK